MEGKLPCKSLWLCFPHSHCWMRDPGKGFGSMGGFVIQSQGTLLWVSLRIRRDTEPRMDVVSSTGSWVEILHLSRPGKASAMMGEFGVDLS